MITIQDIGAYPRRVVLALCLSLLPGTLLAHPEKREAGAARYRDGQGLHVLVHSTEGDGTEPLDPNTPLFEGEGMQVDRKGVAEVLLEDGTVLILGPGARVVWNQLPRPGVSEDRAFIRLWNGPLLIEREKGRVFGRLTVDMPAGQAVFGGDGLVYMDAQPGKSLAGVLEGTLDVLGAGGALRLGPGRSTWLETGYKPLPPQRFTSADVDRRVWEWRMESHKYETRMDEDPRNDPRWNVQFTLQWAWGSSWWELCRYGRWTYVAGYGWCWMPNGHHGWSPYSSGYWIWDDDRWFWVGSEPWGWTPYRYGHWVWDSRWGWVWVPGCSWGGGSVYWWRHGNQWYWCAAHPSGTPSRDEPVGTIVVDDPGDGSGPEPILPKPRPIFDPGRVRIRPITRPPGPGQTLVPRPDQPGPVLPGPGAPGPVTPPHPSPGEDIPAPRPAPSPAPGTRPPGMPAPAPSPEPKPTPAPVRPKPAPAPAPAPPPPVVTPVPLPPPPPKPALPPPKPVIKEDKPAPTDKKEDPAPKKDKESGAF